jgi:putative transcriptional regulator
MTTTTPGSAADRDRRPPTLDELLAAHAAGRLPAPVALAVATHLALSPASRRSYARFEAAGGVLLERLEPVPLSSACWERLLGRLDDEREAAPPPAARPSPVPQALRRIPRPLRDHIPGSPDRLGWRQRGTAAEADLAVEGSPPGYRTSLVRVRAGRAIPRHTHEGLELTLVLEGAFRDGPARYARGDLAVADPSVDHRPTAEPGEDCLCLAVVDARRRLTGPIGRLLNPFVAA